MNRSPLIHERIFNDEEFANNYTKRHKKMVERFGYEYAEKLSSRGFKKGRMIDVGCGFGGTAIVLANRFPDCEIVGIDLSEPLLYQANQTLQALEMENHLKFEMGDVQRIAYEDDSFDVALNINMVHLVENPIQMLNEIERVLKADGFLFLADLRRSWLGFIEKEIKSALTLDEAKDLFNHSRLRKGIFSSSFIWWKYET
jgi:ubiquinone/menaquinone biosynthesis C-methylase UbiE